MEIVVKHGNEFVVELKGRLDTNTSPELEAKLKEETITEFNLQNYSSIPDDIFINFCDRYLLRPYTYDCIGCSQINLDILYSILKKYSLRFRFEKYLYKLFK